ncbi:fimbrial protein [Phytobacter sp. AG2a]
MWRYGIIFFLISTNAWATAINCSKTTRNIYNFTLPSTVSLDHVTAGLSGNTAEYRKLYTWDYSQGATASINCSSSPTGRSLRIVQYVTSNHGDPVYYNSEWIFPTNVNGIGLSFLERRYNNQTIGDMDKPLWEDNNYKVTNYMQNSSLGTRITLWKIPGMVGAADNGLFKIEGFKVIHALQLVNSSDSFSSLPSDQSSYPMPRSYTINAATISGSITFVPGTCNFINKTVQMGSHARSVIGNSSPWVNASFTLNCPEAWGYGMTATMSKDTNNTIKSRSANTATKGIIVTVIPRYDIIDSARGVIGLKPGGAEGYGIQLAWGGASSLPAGDPARPVLFGQSQVVSDENFGTSGNTYTREINMAARYLRTTGTVKGGKADSAIEILASYN